MTDPKKAIGAIRVSSVKQGLEGDSPEAQREQIERFAEDRGIAVAKYFVFLESASKEQQPMQEAIDYCKDPKNQIDCFIIKSIDRFTRGGSLSYDLLKTQLDKGGIKLIDLYGVIGGQTVNTLEHLGIEYRWSKYSPTKKTEILEAERSKDEVRDILSRLIGSAVRYARLGYWVRRPPYGYAIEKTDTEHGKRSVLIPCPKESVFMRKMFELRASGQYSDAEIADKLNAMGYRGRIHKGQTKGAPLVAKHLWKMVRKPVYAGINNEKWTNGRPVRCAFAGLVSIELFNQANKGKREIRVAGQEIKVIDTVETRHATPKGARNEEFPYKKAVLCPICHNPLTGSASTGRSGKKYPAYHCSNKGHNFRVRKQDLEAAVKNYIADLRISPRLMRELLDQTEISLRQSLKRRNHHEDTLKTQIAALEAESDQICDKLRLLTSPVALKRLEQDLEKIQENINDLKAQEQALNKKKPVDFARIRQKLEFMLEHFDQLLVHQSKPLEKARLFGLLFKKLPTYEDLCFGTAQNGKSHQLNPVFEAVSAKLSPLVQGEGFEPP